MPKRVEAALGGRPLRAQLLRVVAKGLGDPVGAAIDRVNLALGRELRFVGLDSVIVQALVAAKESPSSLSQLGTLC